MKLFGVSRRETVTNFDIMPLETRHHTLCLSKMSGGDQLKDKFQTPSSPTKKETL